MKMKERRFFELEAISNNWSLRELQRVAPARRQMEKRVVF
jgi:predicted nuclease of restriction endonuclease-like (RecB) superfamily